MNALRLFVIFLSISLAVSMAMATNNQKLIDFVKKTCSFSDMTISDDDKMDCATDIINCAMLQNGTTDLTKVTRSCIVIKSTERKHEQ